MKKCLSIILIVSLVLFCVSFASAVSPTFIEGAWTHLEDTENGCLITSLYLTEEGTAYFVTQLFRDNEPAIGRAFVGSWSFIDRNKIHIITGNSATLDLTYCSFNMMFDNDLRDYYFRAELRDGDKLQ